MPEEFPSPPDRQLMEMQQKIIHNSDDDGGDVGCHVFCLSLDLGYVIGGLYALLRTTLRGKY